MKSLLARTSNMADETREIKRIGNKLARETWKNALWKEKSKN